MKYSWLAILIGVSLIGDTLNAPAAVAQDASYPTGPVTLVVPFAPGSSVDVSARFYAERLAKIFKQPVVVESIPGANGAIGAASLLSRPADGYNIIVGSNSTHAVNYSMFSSTPYKPEDFTGVACLYKTLPIVAVRSTLPFKDIRELVAYAKENPGKLTFGWSNATSRVGPELIKARAGIDLRAITYKGTPQIFTDMIGGRLDIVVDVPSTIQPLADSGQLRILGVLSAEPEAALPGVPTLKEGGVENAVLPGWIAAFVKAGTPQPIVDKINAAFGAIDSSPEYVAYTASAKTRSFFCKPQELDEHVRKEIVFWGEMLQIAGIKKQ